VLNPEDLTDHIQKFGMLTFAGGGDRILFKNWHIVYAVSVIIGKRQNCPKTQQLSTYQGKIA
jgi:hypothetical protein